MNPFKMLALVITALIGFAFSGHVFAQEEKGRTGRETNFGRRMQPNYSFGHYDYNRNAIEAHHATIIIRREEAIT